MSDPASLWTAREKALLRARKLLRAGDPEGLHDLRVALRRAASTAGALGARRTERGARKIASSLSTQRQEEVDRALLDRARKLGFLSEGAAGVLESRWEAPPSDRSRTEGKSLRRLLASLHKRASSREDPLPRLLAERAEAEAVLGALPKESDDDALHRYRLSVKRARYLAEDLVACGRTDYRTVAARERDTQDTIGRWQDLRLFRDRLDGERRQAERRGAVRLASELDALVAALERPVGELRVRAHEAARSLLPSPVSRPRSA